MPYDDLRKGRFSGAGLAYCITTVTMDRAKLFSDMPCGRLVVTEMRRLHDDGLLQSLAWVLMPDHLHWLFQLGDVADLSAAMKLFKARSARSLNHHLHRTASIWQKAYYDHALRRDEDLPKLARYIIENPLRAGLVSDIGEYSLWDTAWL
ncbi:MAG: transposase [Gammaproteobacteria bacterium]|nr:transposase [Gammaproteobacteria bacterium]